MNKKIYTNEDLKIMQSWDLQKKIQVTQTRIIEWYKRWNGQVYVSFSGGKDSTVLAYLTAEVCRMLNYKLVLWFSDTGLEFPELKEHVRLFPNYLKDKFGIEVELYIDYPIYTRGENKGKRIPFKDVIKESGYPIISKNVSRMVGDVQKLKENCWAYRCFNGEETGMYNMQKWTYLINAPFKISNKCCDIMKKRPAHRFYKKMGLKPIIGTMASESKQRKNQWLQNGCNAFNKINPSSQPISFWTEQDILNLLLKIKIPYASVYGDIIEDNGKLYLTGYQRTGCVFCGYGCHLEKEPNRFQKLKQSHPKLWEYCMKPCEDGGLGMKEVLEFIGINIE